MINILFAYKVKQPNFQLIEQFLNNKRRKSQIPLPLASIPIFAIRFQVKSEKPRYQSDIDLINHSHLTCSIKAMRKQAGYDAL